MPVNPASSTRGILFWTAGLCLCLGLWGHVLAAVPSGQEGAEQEALMETAGRPKVLLLGVGDSLTQGTMDAVNHKTKLICLANPNNPTGRAFARDEFEHFLAHVRDDIVICLDEAYAEYIDDAAIPSRLPEAPMRGTRWPLTSSSASSMVRSVTPRCVTA